MNGIEEVGAKGNGGLEYVKIRKEFGNVECETEKLKRGLREREKLKSTVVAQIEAAEMRAGLREEKLNMCCGNGSRNRKRNGDCRLCRRKKKSRLIR